MRWLDEGQLEAAGLTAVLIEGKGTCALLVMDQECYQMLFCEQDKRSSTPYPDDPQCSAT